MLITPPPVWPNSAEKFDVCTVNSFTVSGENVTTARPRPTPVLRAPSARIDVLPARPPLTNRLNPGVGISDPISGSSVPAAPVTLPTVNARSSTMRLFSGISTICRSVIVCPAVPDPRLMQRRFRRDAHFRRHLAERQRHLQRRGRRGIDLHLRDDGRLEARRRPSRLYSTGSSNGAENVPLVDVVSRIVLARADVGDDHRRAGDDGSGLVEHGPVDRPWLD